MKSRFLFPNSFKIYGVILFIPFLILSLFCLFADLEFKFLNISLPRFAIITGGTDSESITINFTNEIAVIGLIISMSLIAFSKLKFEDEYISKVRLECLQIAIYVNFILLIIATVFIHGLAYLHVSFFNMFTPLLIFILRFHYIIFFNKSQES